MEQLLFPPICTTLGYAQMVGKLLSLQVLMKDLSSGLSCPILPNDHVHYMSYNLGITYECYALNKTQNVNYKPNPNPATNGILGHFFKVSDQPCGTLFRH